MNNQIIPAQGDCTEWYLSDVPELIDWFRSNNYYIAFCDQRKDFVVRTTDPNSEFEEMSFRLFVAITISELGAALAGKKENGQC